MCAFVSVSLCVQGCSHVYVRGRKSYKEKGRSEKGEDHKKGEVIEKGRL